MDIFSYNIGIATVCALKQIEDKMIFKKPVITDGTFHLYPFILKNRATKGPAAKVGSSAWKIPDSTCFSKHRSF